MKIVLLNGSPNEHGCTYTALSVVAAEMEKLGAETKILWIGKKPVAGCISCGKCADGNGCVQGGIVNEWAEELAKADAMVVGSPVYYASVNGSLLALLDRLYYSGAAKVRYKPFAAVVSARRAGTSASMDILHKYALINDQPVVGSMYWNMVHGAVNKGEDVLKDEEGCQTLRQLARNMVYLTKCIEFGKKEGLTPPQRDPKIKTNFIR